jgi:addiction module HigA family antidote
VWRDRDAYDVDLERRHVRGNLPLDKRESGLLPPIHPGEILHQDFMRSRLLSMNELALALGVPATQIGVIHAQLSITADLALGLGLFFGTTEKLW